MTKFSCAVFASRSRIPSFLLRERQTSEGILPLAGDHVPTELSNVRTPGLTEPSTQISICQQLAQACHHLTIIICKEAGCAVNHGFRLVVLADDYRQAARRGLHQHPGRSFPSRREHKNICATIFFADLGSS